jgi:hypothetical protein
MAENVLDRNFLAMAASHRDASADTVYHLFGLVVKACLAFQVPPMLDESNGFLD